MSNPQPTVFLSCGVFKGIVGASAIQDEKQTTHFLHTGLHATPTKLNKVVQEQIDAIQQPCVIVLGYGLCGNGLDGIRAGKHTLIIPKMDDCIAMFMGGRKEFLEEFHANPSTYYLTKGWLQAGAHPLAEYKQHLAKYGEEAADYIMDQQYRHYTRLVYVAHHEDDFDKFRKVTRQVAAYCQRWDMQYEERLGSADFLQQLEDSIKDPTNFSEALIVISPGMTLTQEMFR